jgi:toxin-antitoxin system PIN domain toxin
MLCVDVHVLVYAHRKDLPEHQTYRPLLERLANGEEPLGLPDFVLSGFIRLMTNRRIFARPTQPDEAWAAVDALLAAPAALDGVPATGERHQCSRQRYSGRVSRGLRRREQRDLA